MYKLITQAELNSNVLISMNFHQKRTNNILPKNSTQTKARAKTKKPIREQNK